MILEMAVSHANGYRELGMYNDAINVLRKVSENDRSVMAMFVAIYTDMERWKDVLNYCCILRKEYPEEVGWWIQEAYALRRAKTKGIEEAEKLLFEAKEKFPKDAIIPYNLGCYRCVQGDLKEAVLYVRQAISLDEKYLELAMSDSDLTVIRDFLASTS